MTYTKYFIAGAVSVFGLLVATPASASYMSTCEGLISDWKKCTSTEQSCIAETTAIEEQCKCHSLKQGEWKLVTAAVGKDGVCNATYPYDDTPQPGDPRPIDGNLGKGSWYKDGNHERDRGGPKKGNEGRGNKK